MFILIEGFDGKRPEAWSVTGLVGRVADKCLRSSNAFFIKPFKFSDFNTYKKGFNLTEDTFTPFEITYTELLDLVIEYHLNQISKAIN